MSGINIYNNTQTLQGMSMGGPRAVEKRHHHVRRDILNAGRLPLGVVVFVHSQGTNALHGFAMHAMPAQMRGVKAMPHHITLHLQVRHQVQLPPTANLRPGEYPPRL